MKKNNALIQLLKDNGFVLDPAGDPHKRAGHDGCFCLRRDWEKVEEVVWYGPQKFTYTVLVFVNEGSGICEVFYRKDGTLYKNRWYDTIGKRTYNAIVETVRCAGFQF